MLTFWGGNLIWIDWTVIALNVVSVFSCSTKCVQKSTFFFIWIENPLNGHSNKQTNREKKKKYRTKNKQSLCWAQCTHTHIKWWKEYRTSISRWITAGAIKLIQRMRWTTETMQTRIESMEIIIMPCCRYDIDCLLDTWKLAKSF